MSNKFEKLQADAIKIGWNLSKAKKGEYKIGQYMFSRNCEGEEDQKEFANNLKDVEYFINNKGFY